MIKKRRNLIPYIMLLILSWINLSAIAQTPPPLGDPGNDDFENGILTNFTTYSWNYSNNPYGQQTPGNPNSPYIWGCNNVPADVSTTYNANSGLVQIVSSGYDGLIPDLQKTNPLYEGTPGSAVRINDVATTNNTLQGEGSQSVVLRRKFLSNSSGNVTISFAIAVVLRHNHGQLTGFPQFPSTTDAFSMVRVLDTDFNELSQICLDVPTSISNGWNTHVVGPHQWPGNPDIEFQWLDWTCMEIDFPSVSGNEYYLEFISSDCSAYGDEGYMYVDDIRFGKCRECNCGSWDSGTYEYTPYGGSQILNMFGNGSTIDIETGSTLNLTFEYNCVAVNTTCQPDYLYSVSEGNISVINGPQGALSLSYQPTVSDIGLQTIEVTPICGVDTCPPFLVYVNVECYGCGLWGSNSITMQGNQNWTGNTNFFSGYSVSPDLEAGETYIFDFNYLCSGGENSCDVEFTLSSSLTSNYTENPTQGNDYSIQYSPTIADMDMGTSHYITVTPMCGDKTCEPVTVYFDVACGGCGQYESVSVEYPETPELNIFPIDGATLPATVEEAVIIQYNFFCVGGECDATFDYTTDLDPETIISAGVNQQGFSFSFVPSPWDAGTTKCIQVYPTCEGEECQPFRLCFKIDDKGHCVKIVDKDVKCLDVNSNSNMVSFNLEIVSPTYDNNGNPNLPSDVQFEFPTIVNMSITNAGTMIVPGVTEVSQVSANPTINPMSFQFVNSIGNNIMINVGDQAGHFNFQVDGNVPPILKIVAKTYTYPVYNMTTGWFEEGHHKGECAQDTLYFKLLECPSIPRPRRLQVQSESESESKISKLFTVYPNPSSDKINIVSQAGLEITHISLSDLNGKEIRSFNYESGRLQIVDIKELPSGVYIVTINQNETLKIIKE